MPALCLGARPAVSPPGGRSERPRSSAGCRFRLRPGIHEPLWYLDELSGRSLEVNAWHTTYFHILEGKDPELDWVRGTTLRPVLEGLPDGEREPFLEECAALLRKAYPMRKGRTTFPFTRTFIVAVRKSQ